jgi:hypothetical protein
MQVTKQLTVGFDLDEKDVLAFLDDPETDVLIRLHIIKRAVERTSIAEFDKIKEYLTTGLGAQRPDSKTLKLLELLRQLKEGLDSLGPV